MVIMHERDLELGMTRAILYRIYQSIIFSLNLICSLLIAKSLSFVTIEINPFDWIRRRRGLSYQNCFSPTSDWVLGGRGYNHIFKHKFCFFQTHIYVCKNMRYDHFVKNFSLWKINRNQKFFILIFRFSLKFFAEFDSLEKTNNRSAWT